MTGFRVALGGAQELYGITPDLTALGKIVGGGLPVGAYGGRADIMERRRARRDRSTRPARSRATRWRWRRAWQRSTCDSDHPPYARLEGLGTRLAAGLRRAARDGRSRRVRSTRVGRMWTALLRPGPVSDYVQRQGDRHRAFATFFWAMLERGVYLPRSQFEAAFVSLAHGEAEIDATVAAAAAAFAATA